VLSHSHEDEDRLREAGANVVLPGRVDPVLWDSRLQELLSVPPRLEARIPVRLQAWYTGFVSGKEAIEGATLNLSVRGALLETTDPLDVGSKLDMTFRLPGSDAEIKVVAQVAREAEASHGRPRSAVKFLVLRDDARQRLRDFVEAGLAPQRGRRPAARAPSPSEIPEREEWERELRSSEARKTAILDCALDGIVTIDAEGRITEFNRAAEGMFGFSRADVVGKPLAETTWPPADRRCWGGASR
jgi:PAS domain-containing protein